MPKIDLRQMPQHVRQQVERRMDIMSQRKQQIQQSNAMRDTAEYQRRSMMSRDERNLEAIDKCAEGRKAFNDAKEGKETSFEAARKEVLSVVHKDHRDKGIE